MIEAGMVATEDALLATLARGFAVRAGAGDECGTIATDDELVQIAEQTPLSGRDDGSFEEEIFEA